jgi:uncharacterized membrane protein YeaQ/YmgE (transglycosylase-associated protein family)
MDVLWTLLIGLCAGWLAGQIMKGGGYGVVGDIVVGVIGAFLGGIIFSAIGLYAAGLAGRLVVSTIGAVALIYLLRLIKKA